MSEPVPMSVEQQTTPHTDQAEHLSSSTDSATSARTAQSTQPVHLPKPAQQAQHTPTPPSIDKPTRPKQHVQSEKPIEPDRYSQPVQPEQPAQSGNPKNQVDALNLAKSTTSSKPIDAPTYGTWSIVAAMAFAVVIRAAVGLHPYSGMYLTWLKSISHLSSPPLPHLTVFFHTFHFIHAGEHDPPMYGDYEAQRHWMEITLNVPIRDWYTNTADNDLSYWGLDYPPISAYASYLFGKFIQLVEPNAVRLHKSRGHESPRSRIAMRLTVIFADLVLFFPALLLLVRHVSLAISKKHDCHGDPTNHSFWKWRLIATLSFCLTAPAFILIDHAHFQYNNASLGLFALSLFFFLKWKEAIGASLFCCSIFFKHMSLYYAPAMFSYLVAQVARLLRIGHLSGSIRWTSKIILSIAVTSIVTFAPWVWEKERIFDVFGRLFPVGRGLYEDKVANVWCSISIFIKLKNLLPPDRLLSFCATVTLLATLPFCVAVFLKPSAVRLLLASSGCSLAAFLFSYQVHEKQILIPLLPFSILFYMFPLHTSWMSMSATYSLFPLLLREGSVVPYFATMLVHLATIFGFYPAERISDDIKAWRIPAFLSTCVGATFNFLLVFASAPSRIPDIFVLLNSMYACFHFCLLYLSLINLSFES